ncbi:MAG: polynucleotide adenylyltransferase PcnB [Planctomycetota bacterium]
MTDPRIIVRSDHPISRQDIDKDSLRVLYRLKDSGYDGYLVGGAVRDLLMGHRPKDFDIATDARPRELRRLFKNSREVGKRFRLVHIFFGPKNIEVSTLRSEVEPQGGDDLYVESDNQWGNLESDAFRRDFTVNALYYDIRDFAIIDYVGGVEDIHAGLIRTIGDPRVRFQEDPVRMLRAVKFAARFGYRIEEKTEAAIAELHADILKANRHRVTEEFFRILTQANRTEGLRLLAKFGLLTDLYPDWVKVIGAEGLEQVLDILAAVDADAEEDRYYSIELIASVLFIPLLDTVDPSSDQFNRVAARVTQEIRQLGIRMDLPKRLLNTAVELMRGQLYLLFFAHKENRVHRFVESPWFDPTWRLHLLAFGRMDDLAPLRSTWLMARKRLGKPIGGLVNSPDRRDIFSFRGRTGGGRHQGHSGPPGDDDDGEWAEPELVDAGEEA